jgi:fatty acyl-CoA reductase
LYIFYVYIVNYYHNPTSIILSAFVAGTQEGLLLEKAFQNGETLREGYYMDTEAELQLVDKIKSELTAAKSGTSEQLEKSTMKELGLKRSISYFFLLLRVPATKE